MSHKVLKPPLIEETMEDMENLKLEGGSEWDTMSNLGPPSDGRRGSSQLSVVSGESRRQSLFTEEDLREDEESEGSKDDDEDEERKRIKDEVFVDKTRAAMVVIGAKDIKDALERQKAVEISRKTPEARYAFILFHQAKFLMSQSRFKEALIFLNRALSTDADCKEWLTEKSRCYLNLLQPQTALHYVDQVLQKDSSYFKAIVLKGEVLYSMWDLEKSMLFFVQGRRQRPDNTECIRGIHKVKMALEEIADFRVSTDRAKKKSSKNRSRSAKGRLTSTPPTDCLLRRDQKQSFSSQRPSTRMSHGSEENSTTPTTSRDASPSSDSKSPTTALNRQRMESSSISRSQKSELRPLSAKGKRCASNRPKTALKRRSRSKSASKDLEIEDIRRFVKESMGGSYKSSTLRRFSESTQRSADNSGFSSRSVSSSMEDISKESRQSDISKLIKVKSRSYSSHSHQLSKINQGTKVSTFLGQDKMFLASLLKDRDLKRSHTMYTKRALRIAREAQNFVSEREKYWKNRENFTRFTTTEEDTLI